MRGKWLFLYFCLAQKGSGLNELLFEDFLALGGLIQGCIQSLEIFVVVFEMFFQMLDFSFVDSELFLFLKQIGLIRARFFILPDRNHEYRVSFRVFVDVEIVIVVSGVLFMLSMVKRHEEYFESGEVFQRDFDD